MSIIENDSIGTSSNGNHRFIFRARKTRIKNSPASLKNPADYDSDTDNDPGLSHSFRNPLICRTEPQNLYGLDTGAESGIGSSNEYPWSQSTVHDKHKVNIMVKKDKQEILPSISKFSRFQQRLLLLAGVSISLILAILVYYINSTFSQINVRIDTLDNTMTIINQTIESNGAPIQTPPPTIPIDILTDIDNMKKTTSELANKIVYLEKQVTKNSASIINITKLAGTQQENLEKYKQMFSKMKNDINSLTDQQNNFTQSIKDVKEPLRLINQNQISQKQNLKDLDDKIESYLNKLNELNSEVETRVMKSGIKKEEVLSLIKNAFMEFYEDGIGLYDYALSSVGGRIVKKLTSPTYLGSNTIYIFGYPIFTLAHDAEVVLESDMLPGNCWPFPGSNASIGIRITDKIILQNITIDHVPKALTSSKHRSTAPKVFTIKGLTNVTDNYPTFLGKFEFSLESDFPYQTFAITQTAHKTAFNFFLINFLSNHGNSEFTCVYRIRIHGVKP